MRFSEVFTDGNTSSEEKVWHSKGDAKPVLRTFWFTVYLSHDSARDLIPVFNVTDNVRQRQGNLVFPCKSATRYGVSAIEIKYVHQI